jgi:hypothetical protein
MGTCLSRDQDLSIQKSTQQNTKITEEKSPQPNQVHIEQIDYSDTNSEYLQPKMADMALGIVFFNPCGSKKLLMNYFYTVEKLKLARMPVFTLELCFGNPEIQNAIHLTGKDALFHKEALCRLLEQRVPLKYSKIMFMDCDLLFKNLNWYNETSQTLNSCDAVQPFTMGEWLDPTNSVVIQERTAVAAADMKDTFDSKFHPGFAWAFDRKWFKRNGFFDLAITGSGDTLSAAAWLGVNFSKSYLQPAYVQAFQDYRDKLEKPRLGSVKGKVQHLWHGTKANRKYMDRHKILQGIDDVRTILCTNKDGVLELTDDRVRKDLMTYFRERQDDGF